MAFRRLSDFSDLPSVRYRGGRKAWLYCLEDPRDETVHYIGVTGGPRTRLHWHLRSPQRCNEDWFQELARLGLTPTLRIIGQVSESNWAWIESSWIRFFKERAELNNEHEGGGFRSIEGRRGKPRFAGKKEPGPQRSRYGKRRPKAGRSKAIKNKEFWRRARIEAKQIDAMIAARPLKPPRKFEPGA